MAGSEIVEHSRTYQISNTTGEAIVANYTTSLSFSYFYAFDELDPQTDVGVQTGGSWTATTSSSFCDFASVIRITTPLFPYEKEASCSGGTSCFPNRSDVGSGFFDPIDYIDLYSGYVFVGAGETETVTLTMSAFANATVTSNAVAGSSVVPLPASLGFLALGLGTLAGFGRRKAA